jgi:hypothetical protein
MTDEPIDPLKPVTQEMTLEDALRIGDLGFDVIKWFDNQSTSAIRDAARTLWLSHSGAFVVAAGTISQLTPSGYSLVLIGLSMIAFVWGIYLGIELHVTPAHQLSNYQAQLAKKTLKAIKEQKPLNEAMEDLKKLIPNIDDKAKVITSNLKKAQVAFAFGAAMGLVGIIWHFVKVGG